MKKVKRLFFCVFALSTLIMSACTGGEPDTSSTGEDTSSQEPAPQSSNTSTSSTPPVTSTSTTPPTPTPPEPEPVIAEYRVTIGETSYDLVLSEDSEHDKEYTLGEETISVTKGQEIIFEKYDTIIKDYDTFDVVPSGDDNDGYIYNNVVSSDDETYTIRATGTEIEVFLKLDGEVWSYWISGGGEMPRPVVIPAHTLHIGSGEEWIDKALTANSDSTEYFIQNVIFKADDTFKIKMSEDDSDWRGYEALKLSEEARANFEEEGTDHNIKVKTAGLYSIYVKATPDGSGEYQGKSIWAVRKPFTIKELYVSVDDEVTKLERSIDPDNGWNQFSIADVDLLTTNSLGVFTDEAGEHYATVESGDDTTEYLLNVVEEGENPGIFPKYDGKYSFCFREETDGELTLYLTREGGIPKQATSFKLTVAADVVGENDNVHVVGLGGEDDWTPTENNKLTANETRTVFTGSFDLTPLTHEYKFALVNQDGQVNWNTLNPGRPADKNRKVTGGVDVVIDLTAPVYSIAIGTKDAAAMTDYTEHMHDEDNKFAEYKYSTTVAENETVEVYIDGEEITENITFSGSATDGAFGVAGEVDIYLKLFNGTGENVGKTYYVVYATTPEVIHEWYVKGTMNSWTENESYKLSLHDDDLPDNANHQFTISLDLTKDDEFKFSFDDTYKGFSIIEECDGRNFFHKNTEDGENYDNIVVDQTGKYEFYLKELKNGDYSIYVKEIKPKTIEHVFVSINGGETQELSQRIDDVDGWNQFYDDSVNGLTADDTLEFFFDSAKEQPINSFTLGGDTDDYIDTNPAIAVKYDGDYSIKLNEEIEGGLTLYIERDGGVPPQPIVNPLTVTFDFGNFIGENELAYAWVWDNADFSTSHWVAINNEDKLIVETGEYTHFIPCSLSSEPTDLTVWDDSIIVKKGDGNILFPGLDSTLTYIASNETLGLFSYGGKPNSDGFMIVVNGTDLIGTTNSGENEVKAEEIPVQPNDFFKILEIKTEDEVTSYYYYSKGLEGECAGFAVNNGVLVSTTANGKYDFTIKYTNVDGKLFSIVHSAVVPTATKNGNPIENLNTYAIERGSNLFAYKIPLAANDVIAFTADETPVDLVYWDNNQGKAVAYDTNPITSDGNWAFYYVLDEGIYVEKISNNIAVSVTDEIKSTYKNKRFFIQSWDANGKNCVDYFTDSDNVEIIVNATGYQAGVLKNTTDVLIPGDGGNWGEVVLICSDSSNVIPLRAFEFSYDSVNSKPIVTKNDPAIPCMVTFSATTDDIDSENYSIFVAGTFNSWTVSNDYKLTLEDGVWSGQFEINAGNYSYKFVKAKKSDLSDASWEDHSDRQLTAIGASTPTDLAEDVEWEYYVSIHLTLTANPENAVQVIYDIDKSINPTEDYIDPGYGRNPDWHPMTNDSGTIYTYSVTEKLHKDQTFRFIIISWNSGGNSLLGLEGSKAYSTTITGNRTFVVTGTMPEPGQWGVFVVS